MMNKRKLCAGLLGLFLLAQTCLLSACDSGKPSEDGTESASQSGRYEDSTSGEGTDTPAEAVVFYVSPDGSDSADGSEASPFATPKRAFDAVSELTATGLKAPVTVNFHAGEYLVDGFELTANNGGTAEYPVTYRAAGDGEARFNSGKTIDRNAFTKLTDEAVLARLDPSVQDKILVADLGALGITEEEIGKLNAVGTYSTAKNYPDNLTGTNSELYWGDQHMILARYPNAGEYSATSKIISEGNVYKAEPTTYQVRDAAKEVLASWKEPEKAWVFGFFQYDWAEMTSPIDAYNAEEGSVTMRYSSDCGIRRGARIYFYNVLEELDMPGEYYLDRDTMMLYAYPPEEYDAESPMFALKEQTQLSGTVSDAVFEGITFEGVRGNIIDLSGSRLTFRNCKMRNSAGNAVRLTGTDNLVYGCEVSSMGRSGIYVTGGDPKTLTHGNSKIENCYIHDFGQIYVTYQPGAHVFGCGNTLTHCEISNTPHMALWYNGPEQEISYNYIHDTTYDTNDGGALYVGQSYTSFGAVIRNNLFERIGAENKDVRVIYFDDGMSFASVFGNVIRDCKVSNGIFIGGGRSYDIRNNVLINSGGILIDSRFAGEESFLTKLGSEEKVIERYGLDFENTVWTEKYPEYAKMIVDFSDTGNENYIGNPAGSVVTGNILFSEVAGTSGNSEIANALNDFSGNITLWSNEFRYNQFKSEDPDLDVIFCTEPEQYFDQKTYEPTDAANEIWDYDWQTIPVTEIGRYAG